MAETAKKLGLKSVINIEAVDRSGRGPDGKPVVGAAADTRTSSAPHSSSDVGVDTEALQLPSGGYLYFDVTGVTPSRERTLEEVKDQVETRFRDDEVAKRLLAKADDIVGKLKAGTPFAQVASEAGLKVETATDLQRGKQRRLCSGKGRRGRVPHAEGRSRHAPKAKSPPSGSSFA